MTFSVTFGDECLLHVCVMQRDVLHEIEFLTFICFLCLSVKWLLTRFFFFSHFYGLFTIPESADQHTGVIIHIELVCLSTFCLPGWNYHYINFERCSKCTWSKKSGIQDCNSQQNWTYSYSAGFLSQPEVFYRYKECAFRNLMLTTSLIQDTLVMM